MKTFGLWLRNTWLGKGVKTLCEEYTLSIFLIAIFGIVMAIIGHYGTVGFNWKWFLFFDIPLYLFCIWALYRAYKLYKITKTQMKKYGKDLHNY